MLTSIKYRLWGIYAYWKIGKKVNGFGTFRVGNKRNITIGQNCAINPDVYIAGHHSIHIGHNVILSIGCKIIDTGLDIDNFLSLEYPPHKSKEIIIEDDVWIGAAAVILPGVTVGRKSVVAAGAIVTKNVPPHVVVAGNPARIIRYLDA